MELIYIKIGYLLLTALCLLAIGYGLAYALKHAEPEVQVRKRLFSRSLLVILGWIAVVSILSLTGFLQHFDTFPPRLFPFLLLPVIALIWLMRQARTRQLLLAIPPQWLLYLQAFRIPVELLLWAQFLVGFTPVQMTLEGQNFDILVGLSGPLMGILLLGKGQWRIHAALVWNVLGLGLLLNIVIIAILSFPFPLRVFMNEPANTLITHFPVSFLPLVLVPLAYYLHVFSIRQLLLLRKKKSCRQISFFHQSL
ncbi:hypothetical protein [Cesiribacter andamanensis]|uniref:Uncharacterized protein n=1 Tax=Cesiribacter andamanensis AMV16 TaxID=1279009 RepID=M7NBE3_9BACT|nr:hypothetical protein [Cesiribacter andamanensis]EMR04592.1 hypothetical protein ADICEAN_00194 [Cesiribacter andamanensis AMV16]